MKSEKAEAVRFMVFFRALYSRPVRDGVWVHTSINSSFSSARSDVCFGGGLRALGNEELRMQKEA